MFSNCSQLKSQCLRIAVSAVLLGSASVSRANVGLSEIAATAEDGPITVYYPAEAAAKPLKRGVVTLSVAAQAVPRRGNGRLIVISHGTGGSPWVHADLARALVEAGYVVALPEHRADNYKDHSDAPGALSRRPAEVSRAIDAVGRDARFAPLLDLKQVGVYGMSAGGHTALTIAGGHWSPAGFKRHCEQNLEQDFQFCVGVITKLTGGVLDGLKKWVALTVIRHQFNDTTMREYNDPRVAAVVAAVPAAAIFDMASLAAPRVPLGLVTAQQDKWLVPRFHSDRVLQVCRPCEHIADVSNGGHGALLSPLPPGLTGLLGDMLNDPPGFDRSVMPDVDKKITAFFGQHLLQPSTRHDHSAEVKPRPAP